MLCYCVVVQVSELGVELLVLGSVSSIACCRTRTQHQLRVRSITLYHKLDFMFTFKFLMLCVCDLLTQVMRWSYNAVRVVPLHLFTSTHGPAYEGSLAVYWPGLKK